MAGKSKRQIIIISIAAIALLYGGYALIFDAKPKINSDKETSTSLLKEKNKYVDTFTSDLMKNPANLAHTYIVSRAEAEWSRSPFWEKGLYKEWASKDAKKAPDDPATKIIYSGYIDIDKKKMAVINGIEYSEGDQLEIEGYIVRKITAAKIVLSKRKSGSELEVYIQE